MAALFFATITYAPASTTAISSARIVGVWVRLFILESPRFYRSESNAALRRDRGPGERRLRAATHSPDHRRSRGPGPQEPWLQGHARAARSRDGVHRRRLHGR